MDMTIKEKRDYIKEQAKTLGIAMVVSEKRISFQITTKEQLNAQYALRAKMPFIFDSGGGLGSYDWELDYIEGEL